MVDILKVLKKDISKSGGAKRWAEAYGVPTNLVLDVIAGRREPNLIILNALGMDGSVSQPDYSEEEEREARQKSIRIPTFREITDDAVAKIVWGERFSCLNFPSEESNRIVFSECIKEQIK